MNKRIPPFGKQFRPVPRSGIQVALGAGAWAFAKARIAPIMVLPDGHDAREFSWPSNVGPALVFERGEPKGCNRARKRLEGLAMELLLAGATSVVALRDAYLDEDPRLFFDKVVTDVAA